MSSRNGFTLMEFLIVISVMMILGLISVTYFVRAQGGQAVNNAAQLLGSDLAGQRNRAFVIDRKAWVYINAAGTAVSYRELLPCDVYYSGPPPLGCPAPARCCDINDSNNYRDTKPATVLQRLFNNPVRITSPVNTAIVFSPITNVPCPPGSEWHPIAVARGTVGGGEVVADPSLTYVTSGCALTSVPINLEATSSGEQFQVSVDADGQVTTRKIP